MLFKDRTNSGLYRYIPKAIFLIIFSAQFSFLSLTAQHAVNIEKLKKDLRQNIHDTARIKKMLEISIEISEQGRSKSALIWANMSLDLAKKIRYKRLDWQLYNRLACCYIAVSKYTDAIEYHQKALQVAVETNNKPKIAATFNNIGIVYYNLADFNKTIEYFQKSLKMQEQLGKEREVAATIGNIAVVYADLGEDSLSAIYQQKSFDMHQKMGNKTDMAASLNNLGILSRKKRQFEKALDYHIKALAIAADLDEEDGMRTTYSNLGSLHLDMNNPEEALTMFFKAITFTGEDADKREMSVLYLGVATAYQKTGKNPDAISYFERSFDLATDVGDLRQQKEAADGLYTMYKKNDEFKTALVYHEIARKLNDSIFNTSKNESFNSLKTQFALDRQEIDLKTKADVLLQKKEEEKAKQKTITYIAIGILILVFIFSYIILQRFRITKKQNEIIASQKIIVEHKNKEITDSILYTKRIQQAMIPPVALVKKYFPESFIYFQPKDIVAGDFYWMEHINNVTYMAVADCTGHGVPGAMVSIVCSNALNGALKEFKLTETGLILDKTRQLVIETFEKSGEDIKDGMDISLIKVYPSNVNSGEVTIDWSGANNSLWYIQNGEFKIIKCDKQPIGKIDDPKPFTTHTLHLRKGDMMYLFTDGYADQFGGPKGKKFKYKSLQELLILNQTKSLTEQKEILAHTFTDWKGPLEQVDDVCIIGIQV
jgi:tetratricopeptide (TPR) repeat protein